MTVPANGQETLVKPTTSAVTTNPFPTTMTQWIIVTADALVSAETVNIQVNVGGTATQVLLSDMTTPAKLTASVLGLRLAGGPSYIFVKSVTASACGVYIDSLRK